MARFIRHNHDRIVGNGAIISVNNTPNVASVRYVCNKGALIIIEASEKDRGNLSYLTTDGFRQTTIDRSDLRYLSKHLEMKKQQSEWERIWLSFETTAETTQMGENPKFPLYECTKDKAEIVFSSHRASKFAIFRANKRGLIAREGAFHSATAGIFIEKENLPSFDNRLLSEIMGSKYFQCIRGHKNKDDKNNNDIFIIEIQGNFHRVFLKPGQKVSVNPQKFVGMDEFLEIVNIPATAEKKEDWLPAGQQYNIVIQAGPIGGFVYIADERQEKLDIPERHEEKEDED